MGNLERLSISYFGQIKEFTQDYLMYASIAGGFKKNDEKYISYINIKLVSIIFMFDIV